MRLLIDPRWRIRGYAALALLFAVVCAVPQPYEARAKLVPQDPASLGISSSIGGGGQLGGFAALLGGAKQPIDLYLAVARGREVTDAVIRRLKLADEYGSVQHARLKLAVMVDVHSLTGGVIEIEARTHRAEEAEALTGAYVAAITDRLNFLSKDRVHRKEQVIRARFEQAGTRVVKAEAALNAFRRRNRLAEPEAQLGAALSLRAGLQAQYQAKQIELTTLRKFQGAENPQLQAAQSEAAALRAQIDRTTDPESGAAGPNMAGLTEVSGEYLDRYRDYRFAQALYEVYARASEEIAAESAAAETASDAQVIEAARLDADRKFNIPAVALLALVIALALFTEVYAPATGIRLPLIGGKQ
jgi:uncharacterized protein involved in exopolysaccharide biosynthesis